MKLSPVLFWDVDYNSIDFNKHAPFIIQRVLELGTLDDFFEVRDFYGKPKMKQIIRKLRCLDERTLSFCSIYFNIKPEEFRCYTQKQLKQEHWNY